MRQIIIETSIFLKLEFLEELMLLQGDRNR